MDVLTIVELELAIGHHMRHHPAGELVIPRAARKLADLWGEMIWERAAQVPWSRLTDEQAMAVQVAMREQSQMPLDLAV